MMLNTDSKFSVRKLRPNLGAEISGLDVRRPLDETTFAELHRVWMENLVLVFPDQMLTEQEFVAFSRQFGNLEVFYLSEQTSTRAPEIYLVSNVGEDGKILPSKSSNAERLRLSRSWHNDMSYLEIPASASLLYGLETSRTGGQTLVINMYDVYDALPESLRRKIEGRKARHSQQNLYKKAGMRALTEEESAAVPPVWHPIVRVHPVTKRKAIYISPINMDVIEGLSPEESERLIEEIVEFADQEKFIYGHEWRPRDILMWDNRCTLHRVTPYDSGERRILHRTTVSGEGPVIAG